MHEMIVILDFGGQYNQLIARRVRECNVYCEVKSYKTPLEEIKAMNPKGIIFTGGPNSVYLEDSPSIGKEIFELGIPVLGICYGCQLMSHVLGGKVESATTSEYGKTETFFNTDSLLFKGLKEESITWMSHTDLITGMPEGFTSIAHTSECPVAAMENKDAKLYGMQYHPEVMHTENGTAMLRNFLYEVCECRGDWSMSNYAQTAIQSVREKVGDGKVLLALSGGVDSSVLAALLSKAVGNQLTCIFVDHGLMRKNEGDEVEQAFADWDVNFVRVNAGERFLNKLAGVSDPETKRKIIRRYATVIVEDLRQQIYASKEEHTEFIYNVQQDLIVFGSFAKTKLKHVDGKLGYKKEIADKKNIKNYLFEGYRKSYYPVNSFDSDDERRFAAVLEDDEGVVRFIKPPLNQLGLFYRAGKQYNPDFLVETKDCKYMVEVKAANQVNNEDVQEKARAGVKWCECASKVDADDKKWKYRLVSGEDIIIGNTLKYILGLAVEVKNIDE